MCGCNTLPGNNPLPLPDPPVDPFPREPAMGGSRLPGFELTIATPTTAKVCTGWKIDPENATQEINYCCTPAVGRRGGRYQVAGCLKVARAYDPFA